MIQIKVIVLFNKISKLKKTLGVLYENISKNKNWSSTKVAVQVDCPKNLLTGLIVTIT